MKNTLDNGSNQIPEWWTHSYQVPCGCKSESISGLQHTRKVLSYRKLQRRRDLLVLLPSETTTACNKRTASWSAKWRRWRCRRTRSTSTCRARETRLDAKKESYPPVAGSSSFDSWFNISLLWTLQLTQRLKTAKRQMDEAEEEIERLEHAKKKLQRELDEQIEANEQLHGQLSTLRNEMRWPVTFCRFWVSSKSNHLVLYLLRLHFFESTGEGRNPLPSFGTM